MIRPVRVPRPVAFLLPAAGAAMTGCLIAEISSPGSPFGAGLTAWLLSPYVATAVLLGLVLRRAGTAVWTGVVVSAAVIVVQTVLIGAVTLTSTEDLAAVGVLFAPAEYLLLVLAVGVVCLVVHRARPARAGRAIS